MNETKITSLEEMMPFEWDDEQEVTEVLELTENDWLELDKKYSPQWQSN
jgi:hypothetical protein